MLPHLDHRRRLNTHARLVARATRLNCRARLQYRVDFVIGVANGIVFQSTVLLFAGVIVTRFPGLGGWSAGGVLLIASIRLVGHALYVVLFDSLMSVPYLVREGRIDGYLLRPLPVLEQVLLSAFNINALGDLAVAVTLFGASQAYLQLSWSLPQLAYLAGAIAGAVLIEAALQLAVAALALRVHGTETISMWLEDLITSFGNYPLSIFPATVRILFTYILPIAFIGYLPATVILGVHDEASIQPLLGWASPLVGVSLFALCLRLWRLGLRHYQGNSA